jgi:hypothetical protein
MQRSHATLVQRVGIRARCDQIGNHRTLCNRVPVLCVGTPVGGVVERFGSASVTSAHISALRDERLGELSSIRGGSDMKSRVSAVDVVTDRSKEVRVSILAARPDTNRTACEKKRQVQPPRNLGGIT